MIVIALSDCVIFGQELLLYQGKITCMEKAARSRSFRPSTSDSANRAWFAVNVHIWSTRKMLKVGGTL